MKKEKNRRNPLWNRVISKTDYRVEILFNNLTWKEAQIKEKEFIKLYGRLDLGTGTLCNLTDGVDGIVGQIIKNETREKISQSLMGEKHFRFGKRMSDESRKKMSESAKGKKLSDITRKRISSSLIKIPKPCYSPRKKECNKPWIVKFRRESKQFSLGRFYTEQEAQQAIDKWVLENKST